MPTPPDACNAKLDAWRRQQAEPWRQLGYRIAHTNLARHLEGSPLHGLEPSAQRLPAPEQ
jgi:hypothetical protein